MNNFYHKLESINVDELKKFLLSLKKPCYESELLKIAFKKINILDKNSLSLYQHHFILFNVLFKLKDEFEKKDLFLYIHFMRTFLQPYPEKNKCRFYNDQLNSFCKTETVTNENYCNFHLKRINDNQLDFISEKYFYLDESNYNKLDEKTIEAFLNGTWEILANYNEYKNSFKILDLPESATLAEIKKRFKNLAKQFHPDLNNKIDDNFKKINNAYQVLIKIIPKYTKNISDK